ncbi:MAG: DoxX family protein [Acidobacteriaceae bacterium]
MNTPATTPAPVKRPGLITGLYRRFQFLSAKLESPFLLVIRVFWGWQFAQSGWGRLHNLERATGFFASLNIPAPHFTVICISLLEFVGGILLIAGFATRFIGLLLAGDMIVAYLLSDHQAVRSLFSSDPTRFYTADPFTFLYASLIALIFGAGRYSVDYFIWRKQGC